MEMRGYDGVFSSKTFLYFYIESPFCLYFYTESFPVGLIASKPLEKSPGSHQLEAVICISRNSHVLVTEGFYTQHADTSA